MKSSRQRKLSASLRARNARGKPPRSQSFRCPAVSTSPRSKPPISMKATRPASVSEAFLISSGDALPRIRNFARAGLRSASTRRIGNSPGCLWTSSITMRPLISESTVIGCASRARLNGSSRSKYSPLRSAASPLATVVLPHWRGPRSATMGLARSAARTLPVSDTRGKSFAMILEF